MGRTISTDRSFSHGGLPERISEHFVLPPPLSREQCGHIRHIHNLASQPDGEWAFMGAQEPGQEYDMAFRYQLAHMTYAIGATHFHRLPAQRSALKSLFEKLMNKMLNKAVWDYWYMTSQSGIRVDPDLKELRKPWVDPVCKENIMVSRFPRWTQHIQACADFLLVLRPPVMHDLTLHDAVPRPQIRRKGQHSV